MILLLLISPTSFLSLSGFVNLVGSWRQTIHSVPLPSIYHNLIWKVKLAISNHQSLKPLTEVEYPQTPPVGAAALPAWGVTLSPSETGILRPSSPQRPAAPARALFQEIRLTVTPGNTGVFSSSLNSTALTLQVCDFLFLFVCYVCLWF